ncbi:MAG: transcription factor S [Candidatus Aenigmatarchaeota archaeon]
MLKFCEKCGGILLVKKKRINFVLVCRKCGREYKPPKGEKLSITEEQHETRKGIVVLGSDEGLGELPITKIMCPKCENMEAYWWMQQTRAADEPPTLFYKCKKCGYSWRSYG